MGKFSLWENFLAQQSSNYLSAWLKCWKETWGVPVFLRGVIYIIYLYICESKWRFSKLVQCHCLYSICFVHICELYQGVKHLWFLAFFLREDSIYSHTQRGSNTIKKIFHLGESKDFSSCLVLCWHMDCNVLSSSLHTQMVAADSLSLSINLMEVSPC